MTVVDYWEEVWMLTDTEEYNILFEKLNQNADFRDKQYTEETAFFSLMNYSLFEQRDGRKDNFNIMQSLMIYQVKSFN